MGLLILWKLEKSIYLTNEKTNGNNLWDIIHKGSNTPPFCFNQGQMLFNI